jgi:hypothetical protein
LAPVDPEAEDYECFLGSCEGQKATDLRLARGNSLPELAMFLLGSADSGPSYKLIRVLLMYAESNMEHRKVAQGRERKHVALYLQPMSEESVASGVPSIRELSTVVYKVTQPHQPKIFFKPN